MSNAPRNRCAELLGALPVTTGLMTAANLVLYLYSVLDETVLQRFMICPMNVYIGHEFERLLTNAFFHVGLLHIAFNLLSFYYIGGSLERQLGSLVLIGLILQFAIVGSSLYVMLSVGYDALLYRGGELSSLDQAFNACAVGFSGVIFGLVVVETAASRATTRSLWGCVTVPAWAYPWAMLLALQLLMPSVSFLGHLCGILIGFAHKKGLSSLFLSPPRSWLLRFERSGFGSRLFGWMGPRYVPVPSANPIIHEHWPWVGMLNARLCGAPQLTAAQRSGAGEVVTGVHRGGSGAWARSSPRSPSSRPPPRESTSPSTVRDSVAVDIDEPAAQQEGQQDGGVRGKKKGLLSSLLATVRGEQHASRGARYSRLNEDDDIKQNACSSQDAAPTYPASAPPTNTATSSTTTKATNVGGKSRLLSTISRATDKGKVDFIKKSQRNRAKTIASHVNHQLKKTGIADAVEKTAQEENSAASGS